MVKCMKPAHKVLSALMFSESAIKICPVFVKIIEAVTPHLRKF